MPSPHAKSWRADVPSVVNVFDPPSVEALGVEIGVPPRQIRRMWTQYCKHYRGRGAALAEIPLPARDVFAERVAFHPLALVDRVDSKCDGATKLVFRTDGGFLIESVILRTGTGRTALCVSSQVGCAARCAFCATGQMAAAHNLTPAEILDQLVQAGELLRAENRRVRNVVLMGMGEPFHNEANVYAALDALFDPRLFHHSARYLLVSTVGIPDAMVRFARRYPGSNLALSLHSPRQEVREKLVPIARRYDVTSLRTAIEQANRLQNRPLLVEYLMLQGINDKRDDANLLIAYLDGLNTHVNLIPFNPIEFASQFTSSDRTTRDSFAARLKAAGLTTTIRYSLGGDIAAACGQLVQRIRHPAQRDT